MRLVERHIRAPRGIKAVRRADAAPLAEAVDQRDDMGVALLARGLEEPAQRGVVNCGDEMGLAARLHAIERRLAPARQGLALVGRAVFNDGDFRFAPPPMERAALVKRMQRIDQHAAAYERRARRHATLGEAADHRRLALGA